MEKKCYFPITFKLNILHLQNTVLSEITSTRGTIYPKLRNIMKKILLFLFIALLSFTNSNAQSWSTTLNAATGLPGIETDYEGATYYKYTSPLLTPGGTLSIIRLTVTKTISNEQPYGNNSTFALSELAIYDENGNPINYTANSNADYNTLSGYTDGGGLAALNDGDIKSHFHSMYSWNNPVSEYHYIELVLEKTISSFSIEWSTRVGVSKNAPTSVGITLGQKYTPKEIFSNFMLGDEVTSVEELSTEDTYFVLKGNAQKEFTSSNGTTYTGSGPLFMQCAETGDLNAENKHVVQLIPDGKGHYYVYWPFAEKFLKDSHDEYNGRNGWQYSTQSLNEAALIEFTATDDGYFEMQYKSTYNDNPTTFYIGAEMRDNMYSKMKIFTLEHKQYLESGDYTKGYSLPIAFNWTIYKAINDTSKEEEDNNENDKEDGDETEEEEEIIDEEMIFVYLTSGGIDGYTLSSLEGNYYIEDDILYIPLKDNEPICYEKEEYDSCSTTRPELPTMTSFKFNNKYNPTLFVDAVADSVSENIQFNLNAIGKWLTASFTLSDDNAVAYIDTVQQTSKKTKHNFKEKVTYNVTYPGYNIVKKIKTQDEIWTEPSTETEITDVALTADKLYTNKPSAEPNEGLENLLDNNPYTIFHSAWGNANTGQENIKTYITIDLPEDLNKIQIYYKCRPTPGYNPLIWDIYASNDGDYWKPVITLDYITHNMPTGGYGDEYTSPTIDLGGYYSKIKILQTSGEYRRNHLALSELRIKKVVEATGGEPEKIQDAKYEIKRIPYGNRYNVNVKWLTDIAYSVPRIDIDIDGGQFVTSKSTYLNANFRITGYSIFEDFVDSVQIKGRGNSSWGHPKKPYRLKFADKVKPFGLTNGKSWVLLANAQTGSLMANAIAMKIGQMAGAEYTNHIVPVELYMNGRYMGSYMFTEKVGLANNSVDVKEETGYLLELDDNNNDEYQLQIDSYGLPVYVKEPDLYDYTMPNLLERTALIKQQMNNFCNALYNGDEVDGMVDMDALARFMLANDLTLNQEMGHPKSIFMFRENENDENGKYKFGPIWDFDWGFGYEDGNRYCYTGQTSSCLKSSWYDQSGYKFFSDLLGTDSFKKHYYKVWTEFINGKPMEELDDYIDSYYTFAESSFQNNQNITTSPSGFSASDRDRHKEWIRTRLNYIYNNLDKYDIDDLIYIVDGDVSRDNHLTILDAALITAHLNGNDHEQFSIAKADCDKSGKIDTDDASMVARMIQEGEVPSPTYWYNKQTALGGFHTEELVLETGSIQIAALNLLSYSEEQYKALQFDIKLPEGVSLMTMTGGECVASHNFTITDKGDNKYRITAYSDEDKKFTSGDDIIANIILNCTGIINENERAIEITSALIIDEANNELRMPNHRIMFGQATGIGNTDKALIEGGECIAVTLLEPSEIIVYAVDGRVVYRTTAKEGTTNIALPAGIYIVNGKKVVVR